VKIALTNVLILSKDEAKLVFKDIYRLYSEDIIFLKENYLRYKLLNFKQSCNQFVKRFAVIKSMISVSVYDNVEKYQCSVFDSYL
jgi:hypothetical protein